MNMSVYMICEDANILSQIGNLLSGSWELTQRIFENLSYRDVLRARYVCRIWADVGNKILEHRRRLHYITGQSISSPTTHGKYAFGESSPGTLLEDFFERIVSKPRYCLAFCSCDWFTHNDWQTYTNNSKHHDDSKGNVTLSHYLLDSLPASCELGIICASGVVGTVEKRFTGWLQSTQIVNKEILSFLCEEEDDVGRRRRRTRRSGFDLRHPDNDFQIPDNDLRLPNNDLRRPDNDLRRAPQNEPNLPQNDPKLPQNQPSLSQNSSSKSMDPQNASNSPQKASNSPQNASNSSQNSSKSSNSPQKASNSPQKASNSPQNASNSPQNASNLCEENKVKEPDCNVGYSIEIERVTFPRQGDAVSLLLVPHHPGFDLKFFNLCDEQLLNDFLNKKEGNGTITTREFDRVTGLTNEDQLKALLLFDAGLDDNFTEAFIQSALTRENHKMALGGGMADHLAMSSSNTKSLHSFGIAIYGANVMAASIVIPKCVTSPKTLNDYMDELKGCGLPEEQSVAFMFTCCGRGYAWYRRRGHPATDYHNVETRAFRRAFPNTPVFGFFGGGEIGSTHLPKFSEVNKEDLEVPYKRRKKKVFHQFSTVIVLLSFL